MATIAARPKPFAMRVAFSAIGGIVVAVGISWRTAVIAMVGGLGMANFANSIIGRVSIGKGIDTGVPEKFDWFGSAIWRVDGRIDESAIGDCE